MGKGQNFLQAKGVRKTIQNLVEGGGDEIIPIQNLGRKQLEMGRGGGRSWVFLTQGSGCR